MCLLFIIIFIYSYSKLYKILKLKCFKNIYILTGKTKTKQNYIKFVKKAKTKQNYMNWKEISFFMFFHLSVVFL